MRTLEILVCAALCGLCVGGDESPARAGKGKWRAVVVARVGDAPELLRTMRKQKAAALLDDEGVRKALGLGEGLDRFLQERLGGDLATLSRLGKGARAVVWMGPFGEWAVAITLHERGAALETLKKRVTEGAEKFETLGRRAWFRKTDLRAAWVDDPPRTVIVVGRGVEKEHVALFVEPRDIRAGREALKVLGVDRGTDYAFAANYRGALLERAEGWVAAAGWRTATEWHEALAMPFSVDGAAVKVSAPKGVPRSPERTLLCLYADGAVLAKALADRGVGERLFPDEAVDLLRSFSGRPCGLYVALPAHGAWPHGLVLCRGIDVEAVEKAARRAGGVKKNLGEGRRLWVFPDVGREQVPFYLLVKGEAAALATEPGVARAALRAPEAYETPSALTAAGDAQVLLWLNLPAAGAFFYNSFVPFFARRKRKESEPWFLPTGEVVARRLEAVTLTGRLEKGWLILKRRGKTPLLAANAAAAGLAVAYPAVDTVLEWRVAGVEEGMAAAADDLRAAVKIHYMNTGRLPREWKDMETPGWFDFSDYRVVAPTIVRDEYARYHLVRLGGGKYAVVAEPLIPAARWLVESNAPGKSGRFSGPPKWFRPAEK